MMSALSLSLIAGPIRPVEAIAVWSPWQMRHWYWIGLGIAVLIKSAAAGLLLWLSVATFDRRLGRVAESRGPARGAMPVVPEELATAVTT